MYWAQAMGSDEKVLLLVGELGKQLKRLLCGGMVRAVESSGLSEELRRVVKHERKQQDDGPARDGEGAYTAHSGVRLTELGCPYLFEKAWEIAEMYKKGINKQYGYQQVFCHHYENIDVLLAQGQSNSADDKGDKC